MSLELATQESLYHNICSSLIDGQETNYNDCQFIFIYFGTFCITIIFRATHLIGDFRELIKIAKFNGREKI